MRVEGKRWGEDLRLLSPSTSRLLRLCSMVMLLRRIIPTAVRSVTRARFLQSKSAPDTPPALTAAQ